MSDRFAAMIAIGGQVTQEGLRELDLAAVDDGAGFAWDDPPPETFEEFQEMLLDGGVCLELMNNEARNGDLKELKEVCKRLGLTYLHHNDAGYEYAAELEWWAPGMKKAQGCTSNSNRDAFLRLEDVTKALSAAEAGDLEPLRKVIEGGTPLEVPPLEVLP